MVRLALEALGERLGPRSKERTSTCIHDLGSPRTPSVRSKHRLAWEQLEPRALLTAIPGYDYVVTGYRWSNPAHITYSIAPDGVFWDHGTNNLNATLNAKLGTSGT